MAVNTQYSRIKHHTSTTSGTFTVPPSEDFTDGSWDKWDLAKSEIGVNEADDTAFLRIGSNVRQIYPQTAAGDVCGIDDGAGGYTYYSSLGAAITAASSGDTIEVFSDITETSATEIVLKDGVNINFNGHTYTLNVATTEDAVTDNNVAVTCTLFNGTIKRTGHTGAGRAIFIDNPNSTIINRSMVYVSTRAVAKIDGKIFGGYFTSTIGSSLTIYSDQSSTEGYGITIESDYGYSVITAGAVYENSTFITYSAKCVDNNGADMANCSIQSFGGVAMEVQGCTLTNCYVYSSSSRAMSRTSGNVVVIGSYVKSDANWCINNGIEIHNSTFESNAGHALYYGGSVYNSIIKSSADIPCGYHNGKIVNSSIICTWNNAGGHGIECVSGNSVINCYVEVTNASANCLKPITGTPTTYYTGNKFGATATTPVNASIVQGMTNTEDAYGNIQIG